MQAASAPGRARDPGQTGEAGDDGQPAHPAAALNSPAAPGTSLRTVDRAGVVSTPRSVTTGASAIPEFTAAHRAHEYGTEATRTRLRDTPET